MTVANFRGRGAIQRTREDVNRVGAMTVKVTRVSGRILAVGAGEVSVDVKFPVQFGERPIFTFGGELEEGSNPTAGRYPTVSAVVSRWEKRNEVGPNSGGYYVGATILVVTTGRPEQSMWLHWSMEGKAIRNPVNTIDSTGDTI